MIIIIGLAIAAVSNVERNLIIMERKTSKTYVRFAAGGSCPVYKDESVFRLHCLIPSMFIRRVMKSRRLLCVQMLFYNVYLQVVCPVYNLQRIKPRVAHSDNLNTLSLARSKQQ